MTFSLLRSLPTDNDRGHVTPGAGTNPWSRRPAAMRAGVGNSVGRWACRHLARQLEICGYITQTNKKTDQGGLRLNVSGGLIELHHSITVRGGTHDEQNVDDIFGAGQRVPYPLGSTQVDGAAGHLTIHELPAGRGSRMWTTNEQNRTPFHMETGNGKLTPKGVQVPPRSSTHRRGKSVRNPSRPRIRSN